MTIVQRNVQIKASPQETMPLLSDARQWPDWYPGMTQVNIVVPFPEAGGKVSFKVKSAGITQLQILQMEGMLSGRARWELIPDRNGTCLTTTFDYVLPGGAFGRIADALIVKRLNTRTLDQALQNFKALVERR
jgi:hypothetical protein